GSGGWATGLLMKRIRLAAVRRTARLSEPALSQVRTNMLRNRTYKQKRRGVTLVEYAVIISAVLMLLLAIFEYARFVMTRHLIDNAAREGARLAVAATPGTTTTDIQNRVITGL